MILEPLLRALLGVPFLLGAAAAADHPGQVLFRFEDPAIVEASALVVTPDGLVVTSNDSGDAGRVFAVDPTTGDTVGVTRWSDDPTDVESLAPGRPVDGSATVWVADIGDNTETRSSVQVAQVPVGRGDRTVQPTVYDLTYPDGPHDAETLVRDPVTDRLYIATKAVLGGTLYAVPRRLSADAPNVLTAVGPVLPIATDGAFLPDGRHLIIRNYAAAQVYAWPSLDPLATIDLPAQKQGEGLGIGADGRVLLASEGLHSPVLQLALPAAVRATLDPTASVSASSAAPVSSGPVGTDSVGEQDHATSTADHTASWLVGAGALVLGVTLASVGWRRQRS